MEILGLAIVVLLFLLGVLFIGKFMANRQPSKVRENFVTTAVSSRMLDSFIHISARECSQREMSDILQDCAQSMQLCDNGQDTCRYAESAAKEIFDKTLDKWKRRYYFTVYIDENSPLIILGSDCKQDKKSNVDVDDRPLPTSSGILFVKLEICT